MKLISDGNDLFGATSTASIYFSSDNGLNWESLPLHPDIFPYGVDLFEKVDDYLFFSQNIGGSTYNYRTYYNGVNWEDWAILPYNESIIYEFVHHDNTIYALLNQGISVSSDYGTSWELIEIPSITGYIHLQYVDDQYLYINTGCSLYRYNIETFEWVDITGILDDIGPSEPYSCTSIHQIEMFNDKLLISMYWYGGLGTLFYSQNNGDSWEIINSFPSLANSGYGTNNVSAVTTKNGILYAGTANSEDGIYYTQNLIEWTEYSAGLSNYNLSVSTLVATEENIYKLGGSVNLYQNDLISVSGDIYGCTDPEGCNYDESANIDDGSCEFLDCAGDCGGTSLLDNCGICDSDPSNDCGYECGSWGGDAFLDECGVCYGDGSSCDGCNEGEVELWGTCYNIEETISLDLSNQELNGQIPPEIGNLENLTILDLSNAGLNGQIPPEIGNLENLMIVDLGHNQLTGQIPIQIENLTNLEYLGFNHNQLIGAIPLEIGNLTILTHIRLNYNQLIGAIPSEIGNLTNLEILKLYNNQFTFVSDSICNLTNLYWSLGNGLYDSNIYNNNLCPSYPECIEDYVGYQDTSGCDNTLLVPSEYSTIQSAIDAASEGDSILVSAGTYVENIIWPATNGIKLIGSGEDDCIIDGSALASVIRFEEDLGGIIDSTTLITDFTIQNGYAQGNYPYKYGGGMSLWGSSPTMTDVIFSDNTANNGGGMYLNYSNLNLMGVTFSDNTAGSKGGAIYTGTSSSIIGSYVLINNNYSEGHGAGIFISAGSTINLNNSTIASNIVGEGDTFGAGIYADGGTAALVNSIVYYNRREGDYGINYNLNGYTMDILDEYTVSYSDIEGDENWIPEGEGNISIAPEINDFENGDYNLQGGSPCIDTGIVIEDMEYCDSAPDMGAYEYCEEECGAELADVSGEGQINVLDIVQIANLILEISTPLYECAADYNQDGSVDILDLVEIINFILFGD